MRDVRLKWFSGSGKGGQHRNKHANCCRLIDLETGITAVGQGKKSRKANRRDAESHLAAKLADYYRDDSDQRDQRTNERVRTYHVEDSRMTDHASGLKIACNPVEDIDAFSSCITARLAEKCRS